MTNAQKFVVKFNGRPVRFRDVGVRRMFEIVGMPDATDFDSEDDARQKAKDYNVRPPGLVTVEPKQ